MLILKPLELINWYPLYLTQDIVFDVQEFCPCCENELSVVVKLFSKKSEIKIRVGCCSVCGYIGYIDRPGESWMDSFYRTIWTTTNKKNKDSILSKKLKPYCIRDLIDETLLIAKNKNCFVVDIGVGHGEWLRHIKNRGFKKIYGVENSRHRADTASEVTGAKIFLGSFESKTIQQNLKKIEPIGIFTSLHVIEHVYNPGQIINLISKLQNHGDLVTISVPQGWNEPVITNILFLPHLHHFTVESFGQLLSKNNYEIISSKHSDESNINIIARKTSGHIKIPSAYKDYIKMFKSKILSELKLQEIDEKMETKNMRYYFSKSNHKISGLIPHRWFWRIQDYYQKRRGMRSVLVRVSRDDSRDDPIEIEFDGGIFLCVK